MDNVGAYILTVDVDLFDKAEVGKRMQPTWFRLSI
jgi:hypothetical protein